jgi:hypothetical protein
MAKKQSTLTRSKRVETRVVRYLAGPEAMRDWKDDHDISVEDANGRCWIGEVKSMAWPPGPARLWSLLSAALKQAEKHSDRAFAVYVPCHAEIENALVMVVVQGQPAVVTLQQFKFAYLGLGEWPLELIETGDGEGEAPKAA